MGDHSDDFIPLNSSQKDEKSSQQKSSSKKKGREEERQRKKTVLYVQNLPQDTTTKEVEAFFGELGPVRRCIVVTEKGNQARCRGFGYVHYALESDAQRATLQFTGKPLRPYGKKLIVSHSLPRVRKDQEAPSKQKQETSDDIEIVTEEPSVPKPETKKKEKSSMKEEKKQKVKVKEEPKEEEEEEEAAEEEEVKEAKPKKEKKKKEKVKKEKVKKEKKKKSDATKEEPKKKKKTSVFAHTTIGPVEKKRTLLIENIAEDIIPKRLYKKVKKLGTVVKVIYPALNISSSAGYVVFATEEQAKEALTALHDHTFHGKKLSVKLVSRERSRLIIRNLAFQATKADLEMAFSKFGKLVEVAIPEFDGKRKGFAFVEFEDKACGEKAIAALNATSIKNRIIAVDWAVEKRKFLEFERKKEEQEKKQEEAKEEKNLQDDMKRTESMDFSDEDDNEAEAEDEDEEVDEEDGENDDEDNEDEEDEDEEDEEVDDDDDDDDDDGEVEEKEVENKKKAFPAGSSADVHKATTLFLRNLSFETTQEQIKLKFEEFGKLKYCLLVKDPETRKPRGTAFIQFYTKEAADAALAAASPIDTGLKKDLNKKKGKPQTKGVILTDVVIDGRPIIAARAVDRNSAQKMTDDGKKKRENLDPRNLYLANEGVISKEDPAAKGLSTADLKKRELAQKEKKTKLQNPNFFISKTRLSIRNLPRSVDTPQLRKLCVEAVQKSPEFQSGKVQVKQAKVIMSKDTTEVGKTPQSAGFGFVEFFNHNHALAALRAINNNPTLFGAERRPIVEFAVENSLALQKHERSKEKGRNPTKPQEENSTEKDQRGQKRNRDEKPGKQEPPKKQKQDSNDASASNKPVTNDGKKDDKEKKEPNKQASKPTSAPPASNNKPVVKSNGVAQNNKSKPYPKQTKPAKEQKPKLTFGEKADKMIARVEAKAGGDQQGPKKRRKGEDQFDKLVNDYKKKLFSSVE